MTHPQPGPTEDEALLSHGRGNPNWTTPQPATITPAGASSFEHVVATLGLSPEEYAGSVALRDWAWKNKDHKYVPSELLQVWGFHVDVRA